LPREVLAAPIPGFSYDSPARRVAAGPPGPDKNAIDEAARILAAAESPLIVTASAGRDPAAVEALGELAERFALPVVEHRARHLSLPADHPCHLGYDAGPYLDSADAILVLECDVPWIPSLKAPRPDCKVAHIGVDRLFSRYPIRGFPCDLAVTGVAASALPELSAALDRYVSQTAVAERRRRVAALRETLVAGWQKTREAAASLRPIHVAWASACIARARPEDAILVNEYTLLPGALPLDPCRELFRLERFRDMRAFNAHVSATNTVTFRGKLQDPAQPFIGAPYDERLYDTN
jgi:acetolactate synthase-1/2/3 large subunit